MPLQASIWAQTSGCPSVSMARAAAHAKQTRGLAVCVRKTQVEWGARAVKRAAGAASPFIISSR